MNQFLWQVGPIAVFLILGFTVGSVRERRHFAALLRRECQFTDFGIVNL